MGKTIRFGVSLDSDLLEKFDALCDQKSYQTRSEAIRDLIRKTLVEEEWESTQGEAAGTLTMVYDHHQSGLTQKLTEIQHGVHDVVLSTLHCHLDHHNCLEVLVLKGDSSTIKQLGQKLISCKGVKHGHLGMTTTGKEII